MSTTCIFPHCVSSWPHKLRDFEGGSSSRAFNKKLSHRWVRGYVGKCESQVPQHQGGLDDCYCISLQIAEQVYPLTLSLYHSYQSYAGAAYLIYRLCILLYLLYEMWQVYRIEIRPTALRLYQILATCYLVWFLYLPLIALLALAVNPVRRLLVMSSVYFTFDFLINLGMVLLFCPLWANKYFQFDNYINVLSQSLYTYKSLKSYGGSTSSSLAGPIWTGVYSGIKNTQKQTLSWLLFFVVWLFLHYCNFHNYNCSKVLRWCEVTENVLEFSAELVSVLVLVQQHLSIPSSCCNCVQATKPARPV